MYLEYTSAIFFLPDTTNSIHCPAISLNCVQLVSNGNGPGGLNEKSGSVHFHSLAG